MHLRRAVPIGVLLLSGCGGMSTQGTTSSPVDTLSGRSAESVVKSAQAWMRSAHYAFTASIKQTSTGTGVSGLPPNSYAVNSHVELVASGVVDGAQHVSVTADVVDGPSAVHLVEVGCNGYSSADGNNWSSGYSQRWLTRMLAPNFDDGLASLQWRDVGTETRDSVATHHLQAPLTVLGLSGSAPSPGATAPAGASLNPSTVDLWVSSADGSVVEYGFAADLTEDLAILAKQAHQTAAGIVHSSLTSNDTFTRSSATVSAPSVNLQADPVSPSLYEDFGAFGVQSDNCSPAPA